MSNCMLQINFVVVFVDLKYVCTLVAYLVENVIEEEGKLVYYLLIILL